MEGKEIGSKLKLPRVGMRKLKSLLAIIIGFCIWQVLRIFFPDLEAHPIFVYIYGMLEIRDTSEKTVDLGKRRIKATFIAMLIALPMLFLRVIFHRNFADAWWILPVDLLMLLVGTLLTLELGEKWDCQSMTGVAAVVFMILLIYHADEQRYLYAFLRASQTIIGVLVACFLNVTLFPYPRIKQDKKESKPE